MEAIIGVGYPNGMSTTAMETSPPYSYLASLSSHFQRNCCHTRWVPGTVSSILHTVVCKTRYCPSVGIECGVSSRICRIEDLISGRLAISVPYSADLERNKTSVHSHRWSRGRFSFLKAKISRLSPRECGIYIIVSRTFSFGLWKWKRRRSGRGIYANGLMMQKTLRKLFLLLPLLSFNLRSRLNFELFSTFYLNWNHQLWL